MQENGALHRVEVRTGLTDGMLTEVIAGDVAEGQQAVVGKEVGESAGTTNPFAPNIVGGKK